MPICQHTLNNLIVNMNCYSLSSITSSICFRVFITSIILTVDSGYILKSWLLHLLDDEALFIKGGDVFGQFLFAFKDSLSLNKSLIWILFLMVFEFGPFIPAFLDLNFSKEQELLLSSLVLFSEFLCMLSLLNLLWVS